MALRVTVACQQSGPIPEIVRIARLAESLGYHGLWLNDAQSHWRDVYVSLGAVGAATSRMLLGPGVTNTATRHLTVTASAMYSLDEMTGGRARMGIGTGAAAVEDVGGRPATLAQLTAAVTALRGLWTGQEVSLDGAQCRLRYAVDTPRPIPVYFAASGPRAMRNAGEFADGLLCNVGAEPRHIRAAVTAVEEGAQARGRTRRQIKIAARIPACISDDPSAARYVRARVGIAALRRAPADFDEADLRAVEKIRRAYDAREHLGLNAAYAEEVTDSLVEKFAFAGSPEQCLERVRAVVETGIDELNLAFMHPDTEKLLRIFSDRIMSKL
jgi:5,10-methylenetetrahydromethanopterin reductase